MITIATAKFQITFTICRYKGVGASIASSGFNPPDPLPFIAASSADFNALLSSVFLVYIKQKLRD